MAVTPNIEPCESFSRHRGRSGALERVWLEAQSFGILL